MQAKATSKTKYFGTTSAARAAGCSEATLVNYEKRGIVTPLRTESGHRLFTESDISAARAQRSKHPV